MLIFLLGTSQKYAYEKAISAQKITKNIRIDGGKTGRGLLQRWRQGEPYSPVHSQSIGGIKGKVERCKGLEVSILAIIRSSLGGVNGGWR